MLVKVILLLELLSVFLCVFRVYGQKPKVDVKGVIAFLIMFIILDVVNYWGLNGIYSFVAYIILVIYCKIEFKMAISETIVSVFLAVVISTVIQFVFIIIITFWETDKLLLRTLIGDAATLITAIFVLPFCKVCRLRNAICRRHWLTYLIFAFMLLVIFLSIVTMKAQNGLSISLFLFGIPSIIIIFFLVLYWDKSIIATNRIENEMNTIKSMQENYDELVSKVRENQHGLKNQMLAVFSSHYTNKTYEQLVSAQQEYCEVIQYENKYNNIISVGDKILGGFLYGKMCDIEKKGVTVLYKIGTQIKGYSIPCYYLIEGLGILLDNAVEAVVGNSENRTINLYIDKVNGGYSFIVKNPFEEVPYEKIEEWFNLGCSTKDKDRGIGLYRLKKICQEWKCDISCKNEIIDGNNWIVFELIIKEDGV